MLYMATSTTRTKQSNTLGKEKRISTSPPSSNGTTRNSTHPKTNHVSLPTPKVSSNNHTKSSSNPISDKQIPNYLRPTQSSRHESSHYVKKQGHEETTHKPSLSRRRSFDKPPSASRLHRGLISPGPRERTMTAAAKTNASLPKMGMDRVSRNLKAGKGQEVYVKSSVKKGASLGTKRELLPKRIGSTDVGQTVNIESQQQVLDSVVDDVERATEVESTEMTVPRPKTQNSEINEDIGIQGEKAHQICGISTVCEDLKATPTTSFIEKAEEEKLHEEESQFEKEEENHKELVESYEAKEDAKEDVVEEDSVVTVHQENNNSNEHGKYAHEQEDVNEGNIVFAEEVESKDGKDADNTNIEEPKTEEEVNMAALKPRRGQGKKESPAAYNDVIEQTATTEEEENTAALKHRGGQGKKESPTAYNDVIEETASKLLEKRKNKVKALVGAFETVIDYESSSK